MGASTANNSSGNNNNNNNNNNNQIKDKIVKEVKKEIGLTAVGGLGGQNEGYIAANAPNPLMYGGAASAATKEAMANAGLGTYNEETGSFQNIVGNQIISNANSIMYGGSGGAMGSGDPSGVMSSIPLSKKMLESQNKTKALAVGALSLAMPGIGKTLMRLDAGKAALDVKQSDAAYDDYTKGFKAKQEGKKFTSQRNVQGIMNLGLTKGKESLKEKLGL